MIVAHVGFPFNLSRPAEHLVLGTPGINVCAMPVPFLGIINITPVSTASQIDAAGQDRTLTEAVELAAPADAGAASPFCHQHNENQRRICTNDQPGTPIQEQHERH